MTALKINKISVTVISRVMVAFLKTKAAFYVYAVRSRVVGRPTPARHELEFERENETENVSR